MPYAVTLLLNEQAAEKACAVYCALSRLNILHDQINLGYPPHLTLAVLDDRADVHALTNIVSSVAKDWRAWQVRIAGFGIFPGTPSALWLWSVMPRSARHCHQLW
jgi:2'-5' RNA ligase